MTDIWQLLERDAPSGCSDVQDLYSWSLNYDAGKGPFTLFLDLIGWSEDELGETIYELRSASLGYVELSKLADALNEYTAAPNDVREYVDALMNAAGIVSTHERERWERSITGSMRRFCTCGWHTRWDSHRVDIAAMIDKHIEEESCTKTAT